MPARLYRELIGDADRRLLITHGIYGSGANWRAIARKVTEQRRDWGVVLVDLRGHGREGFFTRRCRLVSPLTALHSILVSIVGWAIPRSSFPLHPQPHAL